MYYYFILALQFFCFYHAYTNRKDYFWYLVILMIPVIGAIIYIITQVINTPDGAKVKQELTTIINPTKKVRDLEKQLAFADTFQNRINLADAYFEIGDYTNALIHYKQPLQDNYRKDFYVVSQMIMANHQLQNHAEVVRLSEEVKGHYDFQKSKTQFLYGLALEKLGRIAEAEVNLQPIDQRYSNYEERLRLAEFFHKNGKTPQAKELLDEIITEAEHMTKPNRRTYRQVITNVRKFKEVLDNS